VVGTALDARTVVRVRWAWFALLAAQLLLTVLFLGGIVVATVRVGLQNVKGQGSSVAALCVLDEDARRYLGPVGDVAAQSRLAADMVVKLQRGESLVLRRVEKPDS